MSNNHYSSFPQSPEDGPDSLLSPTARNSSSLRTNPLFNKLTTILSSSYNDSDIRDSLGILDARGFQNNADTRRKLRLDAQKEVIDCNGEIVDAFGEVAGQLERIGAMIMTLNRTCDEIRQHIIRAGQESGPMLHEASTLMANKQDNQIKSQLLDAFNKRFVVSEDDVMALTSSVEPVNERFFSVLGHVKRIHQDCEVLLGNENQRLGEQLMEQTSRNLNSAFTKLHSWIQRDLKTMNIEDPHISGSVRRALTVLAERPALFQNSLNFLAESREQILSDAFHAALTETAGGVENPGSAKPIEFSTYDLLRYVGDMLAWVHSAAVSEKEALEGLFIADGEEIAKNIKAGEDNEPWSRSNADKEDLENEVERAFDGHKALNDLVDRDLAGVCRTLRQRTEVAVRNNDEPIVIYKALNVLKFYHGIFSKLLSHSSGLSVTTSELEASTFSHFEHLLQDEAASITVDPISSDLAPPSFLAIALEQFASFLKTAADPSTEELSRLFSAALSPFLAHCADMVASIQDPIQQAVFELNNLLAVRAIFSSYSGASSPFLTSSNKTLQSLKQTLVDLQHHFFLQKSGVQLLLDSIYGGPPLVSELERPPAPLRGTDDSTISYLLPTIPQLSTAAAKLDAFLPTALMDALDNVAQLIDKRLGKEVTEEAVERFCGDFEHLEDVMENAAAAANVDVGSQQIGKGDEEVATGGEETSATAVMRDGNDANIRHDEDMLSPVAVASMYRDVYPRTSAELRVLLS